MKDKSLTRNILLGISVIVLVLCIGLFIKNKTNNLNTSSINKESITKEINNNLIGAYIQEGEEYIQTDDIPSSGYEFNEEKSYCKIGEDIQESTTLSYDINTQTLTVSPITKEGLKCYLYFDEKASGSEYILAGENAPINSTTDWTNGGKGITYYYTGNPNNWVQFAGFYWRIIRINGNGSIRMIYQGVADSATPDEGNIKGSETQIGTNKFNNSFNNNMYVGFKYTSDQVHGTEKNSTILGEDDSNDIATLNGWYRVNLLKYADDIDGNVGFCGDRTPSTSSDSINGSGGTGTIYTYYGAFIRLYNRGTSNSNPSLQCDSRDVYTTTDSNEGNKSLQYPIGLVTADEVALTGITWNNANTGSYLYTGQYYWTMSPFNFDGSYARVFRVGSNGSLASGSGYVTSTWGVRPVINIRADVQITGSGTTTNPFKVVGAD